MQTHSQKLSHNKKNKGQAHDQHIKNTTTEQSTIFLYKEKQQQEKQHTHTATKQKQQQQKENTGTANTQSNNKTQSNIKCALTRTIIKQSTKKIKQKPNAQKKQHK